MHYIAGERLYHYLKALKEHIALRSLDKTLSRIKNCRCPASSLAIIIDVVNSATVEICLLLSRYDISEVLYAYKTTLMFVSRRWRW